MLRRPVVVTVATIVLLTGFTVAHGHDLRSHSIPPEDLRSPAHYVQTHRQPGDVVALSMLSSWGYAYYSHSDSIARQPVTSNLQGYVVSFADPRVVVATDRSTPAVLAAVVRARALLGSGGHIWVVREHVSASELSAWNTALAGLDVRPVLGSRLLEVTLG